MGFLGFYSNVLILKKYVFNICERKLATLPVLPVKKERSGLSEVAQVQLINMLICILKL